MGLAVGDTETMKKFATVKRLAMQIEYQIEIEEAFPRFLTRAVYETVYVEKPNKLSKYHRYGVNSNCCCNQSLNITNDQPRSQPLSPVPPLVVGTWLRLATGPPATQSFSPG